MGSQTMLIFRVLCILSLESLNFFVEKLEVDIPDKVVSHKFKGRGYMKGALSKLVSV